MRNELRVCELKVAELRQFAGDLRLIGGLEDVDDHIAFQRAQFLLASAAKENISAEERKIGNECSAASPHALLHLRQIERHVVLAKITSEHLLLSAFQMSDPPRIAHLEDRFGKRIRLPFENGHFVLRCLLFVLRPARRTKNEQRGTSPVVPERNHAARAAIQLRDIRGRASQPHRKRRPTCCSTQRASRQ